MVELSLVLEPVFSLRMVAVAKTNRKLRAKPLADTACRRSVAEGFL
jgi:hypothetical protein